MKLSPLEQNLSAAVTVTALGLIALMASMIFLPSHGIDGALVAFALSMLLIISGVVLLIRKLRRAGQAETINYLNIGIQRYVLGLFMVKYGVPKVFGTFFDYQLFALDAPMGDVADFELAWYFYGRNPWHELFAGVMELIPGLLLFHRRTYYLGAIILLPVVSQVFILNSFFNIGVITFPLSVGCCSAILRSS